MRKERGFGADYKELRIVADNGTFDTGVMVPGSSFTVKAGDTGTVISYHCVLHSRVKGQIVADLPAVRRRLP